MRRTSALLVPSLFVVVGCAVVGCAGEVANNGNGTGGATTGGGASGTAGANGGGGRSGPGAGGATNGQGGSAVSTGGVTGTAGGGAGGSTTSSGGMTGAGGAPGMGGVPGTCDPGTSTTACATSCPTAPATTCVAGTWTAVGPDSGNTDTTLVAESAHFAVYSNGAITAAQGMAATDELENVIWPNLFGSPIFFPEPYCSSTTKSKASVVVKTTFGLTGGGFGNGFMGMWIGPGATADHWGLAHEFMHSVQSTTRGLQCQGPPSTQAYCGWIYESHANWRAQQLPEYHQTAIHCSEMLVNAPNIYLGSTRTRYCNWQFMEFLKDKYCYKAVNDIWTSPTTSNDPFTNIMTTRGWTVSQLNDFFGEWATHNVTWDYQDPPPGPTAGMNQSALYRSPARSFTAGGYDTITSVSLPERRMRTVHMEVMDATNRRYAVPPMQAPQRWGYNIIRLFPDPGATSVTVTFRGVTQTAANSDWRWAMVATDSAITKSRYSQLQRGSDGALTFCVNAGEALWLVVTATPSVQQHVYWDQLYPSVYRYPYMIQVAGAQPDGYQASAPKPSATGAVWANGGGWVATGANVATGAFVGPYAAVLGGTVGATARVDDHAIVMTGSTLTSGTANGMTILMNGFTVSGSARVTLGWPNGPGWFERPVSVSGTAVLLGDIEYRGANLTEASGSYCGFVDNTITSNCTGADVTVAPPYVWRP